MLHDDPLTEGLNYWLDGNTDVPITWGSIVEVLASHHVEEYVLAEILREKFSKESYKKTSKPFMIVKEIHSEQYFGLPFIVPLY